MTAPAFTKFDPRAFLGNEKRRVAAAKPAKAAKEGGERTATLATLATLAGGPAEIQNFEPEPHAWTDAQEERAAIVEFDAGAPREWAEALARLDPARPAADVPPLRWLQFIDDCGRFLDDGWAARAAALGWRPLDLFGCEPERPLVRHDHAGLLWLLNGRRLLALTASSARIETATGSVSYYRMPNAAGQIVLPWELRD